MPWPAQLEQRPGFLNLNQPPQFEVSGADERVTYAVRHFSEQLSARTGVPLRSGNGGPPFVIHCKSSGAKIQTLGEDESYQLNVDEKKIELTADNPLGILRGVETLLQLVQPGVQGWTIPDVQINDHPRFAWRGLMIDTSRHFMPVEILKRNIDGMAAVKLNILHLHLSDDEGFRVESRRCRKFQALASDGAFYTQSQIRDLIAYARERGIRIVPEFDVPGHSVSWQVAYPELSSLPLPSRLVRDDTDHDRPPLDPTLESTYKLLGKFFGEMTALFPDKYFHIGGDEVDGKYWDKNERIQAWMHAHNIKDDHALQAYFNKRVQAILAKHGKRMEGWDEILSPDLPQDTLVQSWRGPETLASAAKMGFQTLLSAGWYLDLMYPASQHYAVEPLSGESASLAQAEQARIIGGEAAQWAEYVTPEILDNRLWPRLAAIAERLWSPASVTDQASMYRRLAVVNRDLEWLDLTHRTNSQRMIDRIAGDAPVDLLETLASALEPVKEYGRGRTESFSTQIPLNRLVDAIPPESDPARRFTELTASAVHDPSLRPELRKQLLQWRDNDAKLQSFLPGSVFLSDLAPLSHDLSALGSVGLEALDTIESGQPMAQEKRSQQLAIVEASSAPHAEMMIVIVPAIRHLVEAQP
ncbi:MAG TPA: family 20 glycosylhydrolase [Terriglobales bacterium]|nr:family 20 glycosylhydrolase [Terriglobales bacterium]